MYLRNKNSYLSLANLVKFCSGSGSSSHISAAMLEEKKIKRFSFGKKYHFHANNFYRDLQALNPVNPNIKIQILICCHYTFLIEVVRRYC